MHKSFASISDVDPFPYYDAIRAEAPLVWDEGAKAWLVTTYEHCAYIEVHEELFRHPYADEDPDLREIKGGDTLAVLQGDRHDRMHRFLLSLFSPRMVRDYREHHIKPIIHELLSGFIGAGKVELTGSYSDLLPPRVILNLLNMPWQNDDVVRRVLHLHDIMMAWASGQNPAIYIPLAKEASAELNGMLRPFVRERRSNPSTDLISRVWTDWPAELGEVNEAEAQAVCREMFMAGSETTVHALANALYILLIEPGVMQAVRADRTTPLTNLVEEALRLYGAVQYRPRMANQDCELGGVKVAKDDMLICINSAANRDPARYGCPADVDLRRARPSNHLAFNTGPRTCVGAALARAEMIDAIGALLDHTENLRLDPNAPGPRFPGHFNRSFRPLHVLFDPA